MLKERRYVLILTYKIINWLLMFVVKEMDAVNLITIF